MEIFNEVSENFHVRSTYSQKVKHYREDTVLQCAGMTHESGFFGETQIIENNVIIIN